MLIDRLFRHLTFQIFSPGTMLREKYEAFRKLLLCDRAAHELMADLQDMAYGKRLVDFCRVASTYEALSDATRSMIDSLTTMAPLSHLSLPEYFKKIDFYARLAISPPELPFGPPFIFDLQQSEASPDPQLLGGKAYYMAVFASRLGLDLPRGFVITTNAFIYFLEANDLRRIMEKKLMDLDPSSSESLKETSWELTAAVCDASIPPPLEKEILSGLSQLRTLCGPDVRLAVRSSAVSEDSERSFAGQYLTVLDVGMDDFFNAYKKVLASKYSPSALYYRIMNGFIDAETPMGVIVIEMIDPVASGVILTTDSQSPEGTAMSIHATWGLGDLLVSGRVKPDIFSIKKSRPPEIILKNVGYKEERLSRSPIRGGKLVLEAVPQNMRDKFAIDDETTRELASKGMDAEHFFGRPQEMEWCMDGEGKIFFLQSRNIYIKPEERMEEAKNPQNGRSIEGHPVIFFGVDCASAGIGAGRVAKVDPSASKNIPHESVLVTRALLPSHVEFMGRIRAVVTERGSAAGHFAIVARECGVPVLVAPGAYDRLSDGQEVTVEAHNLKIYQGILPIQEVIRPGLAFPGPESPFMSKLSELMKKVTPLRLTDPASDLFAPEECRSIHDIIRFCHEKAMQAMFNAGSGHFTRGKGVKRLVSALPFDIRILDVGKGLIEESQGKNEISPEDFASAPMLALWHGLAHPDIQWSGFQHFDWKSFDAARSSGGIASSSSDLFASYAILAEDYVNINIKFGYHFTILDSLCGEHEDANYIMMRFAGGGGDPEGRKRRLDFMETVLRELGFAVETRGDMITAQVARLARDAILKNLVRLGALLGVTRLLDMAMTDQTTVERFVGYFLAEQYGLIR